MKLAADAYTVRRRAFAVSSGMVVASACRRRTARDTREQLASVHSGTQIK